jgi:hypothetical protein
MISARTDFWHPTRVEWLVGHRYISNHSLAAVVDQEKGRPTKRRRPSSPRPEPPTSYTTSRDLTPGHIFGASISPSYRSQDVAGSNQLGPQQILVRDKEEHWSNAGASESIYLPRY